MSKNLPPLPPAPHEEEQMSELGQRMDEWASSLERRNLNAAIQLAMEAARGEGPLVEHFIELGRRFGDFTVRKTRNTRDRLRLIKGGKD